MSTSTIIFNKDYWIEQLSKEVGLPDVPYEELHLHRVQFGLIQNDSASKSAREYVDEQLAIVEKQYASVNLEFEGEEFKFPDLNADDVFAKLLNVSESMADEELPYQITLEEGPASTIKTSNLRHFEVQVGTRTYYVVINDHGDLRIKDHIKHVINTSFFIAEKDAKDVYNNSDSDYCVISYYQFVNLIQPYLNLNTVTSAFDKITKEVVTEFDGIKLENF